MASILIVHSDDTTEWWATSLRAKGFAVHRVCNPEEAISYIDQHPPAVLVTDLQFRMSAYDGAAFIKAVRQHEACERCRIIVCSKQRPDDTRHFLSAGADVFLGPTDEKDLPRHLTQLLSQYRRAKMRRASRVVSTAQ